MISERATKIPPFIVMDVMEKAEELQRAGEDIVHLEVGEPDFDTPEPIKEAARKAMRDGETHYTHSLGIYELREAIAHHYHIKYDVDISPDRIIVTSGTSPAMLLIFSVLLNNGDETVLSDPHYACYPNFIKYVDGKPVYVKVFEENAFQYCPQDIQTKLSPRVKAILINSPANPTGQLLNAETMKEISCLGPFIISDEIYHGLVYEGKEHSILEFTDRAFVINGFSKLYAMTGWRLGYAIVPQKFIRPMQKLQQNLFISAGAFVQRAGIAALTEAYEDVARMVKIYDERRRHILKRLKEIGLGIAVDPTGAFYVLANAKRFSRDSYKLAFDILERVKVAVTPGIDFGENAEGYLRFSYANSMENIEEGMRRLKEYFEELKFDG